MNVPPSGTRVVVAAMIDRTVHRLGSLPSRVTTTDSETPESTHARQEEGRDDRD
jgi:hypothetical protein